MASRFASLLGTNSFRYNAIVPEIGKFTCIMGERMQFAPTITGYPNKIGFTGKIYPEHLVLNQDLLDFEDDRERFWFGGNGL